MLIFLFTQVLGKFVILNTHHFEESIKERLFEARPMRGISSLNGWVQLFRVAHQHYLLTTEPTCR